jgi:hypothetical protein
MALPPAIASIWMVFSNKGGLQSCATPVPEFKVSKNKDSPSPNRIIALPLQGEWHQNFALATDPVPDGIGRQLTDCRLIHGTCPPSKSEAGIQRLVRTLNIRL